MNPFAAELGGLVPAPRAAEDFSADLAPLVPKPRTGIDALLGRANDFARDLATVPSREEAGAARLAAADALNPNAPQARAVTTENADRTWSELFGDLGSRAHAGVRSGVAAMAEAPVNLLNVANRGADMLPGSPTGLARDVLSLLGVQAPEAAPQPEFIADFAAQQRELAARDRADVSMKAGVQADELAAAQGFLPTAELLLRNPSIALTEGSEVAGQMVPAVVPGGGTTAQILSQAVQAGSMNAAKKSFKEFINVMAAIAPRWSPPFTPIAVRELIAKFVKPLGSKSEL